MPAANSEGRPGNMSAADLEIFLKCIVFLRYVKL